MINRRQAIAGVGGAAAMVALIAAGFDGTTAAATPAATTAVAPPTTIDFTHRNHKISITISDTMVMAVVDNHKSVHIAVDSLKRFHSHLLPFSDYTDPKRMLSDLVDMHDRGLLAL